MSNQITPIISPPSPLTLKGVRVAAIAVREQKILLMHRKKNGQEYWVFPGGTLEPGETLEACVVRELQEETSLTVMVQRLVYDTQVRTLSGDSTRQVYFLVTPPAGTPRLGAGIEQQKMSQNQDEWFQPEFVPIAALSSLLIYPKEIKEWVILDLEKGFDTQVRTATLTLT